MSPNFEKPRRREVQLGEHTFSFDADEAGYTGIVHLEGPVPVSELGFEDHQKLLKAVEDAAKAHGAAPEDIDYIKLTDDLNNIEIKVQRKRFT